MPYHILVHGKTCITVIFDLSILIYGAGVVQNMAILGVKTGLLWQACWGVRTQPGNLLMRHITSHYMAEHVFGPFLTCPCTFMAQGGGPKYGHLGGKNWLSWQASYEVG